MFCLKCGKEIDNSAMKCPYCNCPTENAGSIVDINAIDPTITSANNFGTASIVLGAIGIALSSLMGGWLWGGIGLVLALIGRNKNKFVKKTKIGMILSAIALGCSFISTLGYIFMFI